MDNFEKHKPFKKARLYDAHGDLSKRWYINFQVWSELKNKLVRKRDYSVNNYETEAERRAYAKKRIKEINQLLESGYYIKMERPEEMEPEEQVTTMRVKSAFDYVLKLKKREVAKGSHKKIRQVRDSFFKFFDANEKPYPHSYTQQDIIAYSDFLITKDGKSTKTRNDNISWLRHIFGLFQERGWVNENPVDGIKKLKVTSSAKNKAYNIEQMQQIIGKADPQLYLSILFFYYCFMRRNEIRLIQLRHINLKEGQLYIPAEVSKNRKEAYIVLPPPLIKKLKELDLSQYPVDYYLIGSHSIPKREVLPADSPFSENVMYERHKKILKALGLYGNDYTLYSWKHTGVVTAYKAGIDIKSIQLQCRHYSLEQTDIYLKSLGLYKDKEVFELMPELKITE